MHLQVGIDGEVPREFIRAIEAVAEVPDVGGLLAYGDVAMDVSTTLKKLGCVNVTDCVYETFAEFKASKKELEGTRKEGVTILDGYVPVSITKGGVVTFKHRVIKSQLKIKAPLIILAVGQVANLEGLDITLDDCLSNSQIKGTNVFVAGDLAVGDKTVVYAVRTGKNVCKEVMSYLGGKR